MSVRRSARLQSQETQELVEVQQSAPFELVRSRKRKALAARKEANAKRKAKVAHSTIGKGKDPPVQAQPSPTDGALSTLPPEILDMILNNINDQSTMGKLGRTCKSYYSTLMPRLHKRVAIAAMFHAHISKLIRALEPHLTIAQKKQLKKEGKYKGQQDRYSSHLDENAKPVCANYVRQIVVGVANPGRKHEYIVRRYIEEAFENMKNLEIVETRVLTKSMGHSLASLKNLQALCLFTKEFEDGAMKPLAKIKNLKHLSVEDYGWGANAITKDKILQSILINSRLTLQSLDIKTSSYASDFLQDWEKRVSTNDVIASPNHDLTALQSLALSGISFDATFINSLQRAIDFTGLRELTLGSLADGKLLFLQHLISLTSSSQNQIRFQQNPGLSDILLYAILKHENLRSLRICYSGVISGRKIPYLSVTTVATIINNLPQLQEFEFAPEEAEMNEIGQALSYGTKLTSITCFPHDSWAGYPRPAEPGLNILSGILNGYLSRDGGRKSEKFIWEDHFKLKRVSVSYLTWDVASNFGQSEKGMKKPVKMKIDGNGKREVLYRDISGTFYPRIHVGYDPNYEWLERVAKDID
ncbi:Fc.00g105420.m01.CDS01 [Cosmosporella sp. VM-42]